MDLLTPDELARLDLVCKRLALSSASYRLAEAGWSGSIGYQHERGRYFLHLTRGEEIRLIDTSTFAEMVAVLVDLCPENACLIWRPPPGKPVASMDYQLPVVCLPPEKPTAETDAD